MPMPVVRPWAGRSLNVAFYAFHLSTLAPFSAGLGMKLRSSYFMNAIDKLSSSLKPPEHPRKRPLHESPSLVLIFACKSLIATELLMQKLSRNQLMAFICWFKKVVTILCFYEIPQSFQSACSRIHLIFVYNSC